LGEMEIMEEKIDALYGLVQQIAIELKQTRQELNTTKGELTEQINGVREELTEQITGVQEELRGEIAGTRTELGAQVTDVRNQLHNTRQELGAQITGVREELYDTRRDLTDRLNRMEQRLNATFNQVGMLSEFRVEVLHKLEELGESQNSMSAMLGEHDIKIRNLSSKLSKLQLNILRRSG